MFEATVGLVCLQEAKGGESWSISRWKHSTKSQEDQLSVRSSSFQRCYGPKNGAVILEELQMVGNF